MGDIQISKTAARWVTIKPAFTPRRRDRRCELLFRSDRLTGSLKITMQLSNNQNLYDYLIRFARELKDRGATEASEVAMGASRQAASMNAEFLGESRIAPRRTK
jgi:hypothetical protein